MSFTANWTRFTHAELSRPPATKYTSTMQPAATAPTHRGQSSTTCRIVDAPSSCPARMDSDTNQMRTLAAPRMIRP